jgi:DNA (cytosine-5)-methyltransferase 1
MKFLSVCSGIEAASVAWHPLGWESVAYSEIEPFPCKVLQHHYPAVPNLGDMTKFKEWPDADVNVFVGGTPCQSFSVAGLRKGLDDPRGNLMLTYLAIADKYKPKWLVWENVPGVLSSNGGKDFGVFLGALGELGYGFAYRILDAQYFGVAQRRRRVFVVGYLGDWRPAAAVLFERHSLSGNPAPSREKREAVAASTSPSPVYGGSDANTSDTVTSKWAKGSGGPAGNECGLFVAQPVYEMHGQDSRVRELKDVCTTVSATYGSGGGNVPVTLQPIAFDAYNQTTSETVAALRCAAGGVFDNTVAQPLPFGVSEKPDVGHCLRSGASKADKHESTTYVAQAMAVRRLTPVECERLQGFPDKYTDIQPKGKATPDGPRYKALGNSMAVPVMAWIGKRIQEVDAICKTQQNT